MGRVLAQNVLVMIVRVTASAHRCAALLRHNVRKQGVRIINAHRHMIHCLRTVGKQIIIRQRSWMFGRRIFTPQLLKNTSHIIFHQIIIQRLTSLVEVPMLDMTVHVLELSVRSVYSNFVIRLQ